MSNRTFSICIRRKKRQKSKKKTSGVLLIKTLLELDTKNDYLPSNGQNSFWKLQARLIICVSVMLVCTLLLYRFFPSKALQSVNFSVSSWIAVLLSLGFLNVRNIGLDNFIRKPEGNIAINGNYYAQIFIYYFFYYIPFLITIGLLFLVQHNAFTSVAILWSIVFSFQLFFVLYRWTYRILPNVFLAGSFLLFYNLLVSVLLPGESVILNQGIMDDGKILFFLSAASTKWIGLSILGTALTTAIGKASEDIWYGLSRNGTGEYAKINYRFKTQRRRLLGYRGKYMTSIGWLIVGYVSAAAAIGISLLFCKTGIVLSFEGRFYFVAAALALIGFVLHRFITDDHLLRSENAYVKDRRYAAAECINKAGCGIPSWEWSALCQVLSNIYCSESPISYENQENHNKRVFFATSENVKCKSRFLAEMANMRDSIFSLYCYEEAEPVKLALETQFANMAKTFLDKETNEQNTDIILFSIMAAYRFFFFDKNGDDRHWFYDEEIPYTALKHLTLLDYFMQLVSKQDRSTGCPFAWICCDGNSVPSADSRNRKLSLMLLEFPFVMKPLLHKRILSMRSGQEEQTRKQVANVLTAATYNYYKNLKAAFRENHFGLFASIIKSECSLPFGVFLFNQFVLGDLEPEQCLTMNDFPEKIADTTEEQIATAQVAVFDSDTKLVEDMKNNYALAKGALRQAALQITVWLTDGK